MQPQSHHSPRWAFGRPELEQALQAYERQGQGDPETRQDITQAVRAFLQSPYGQCLRERESRP